MATTATTSPRGRPPIPVDKDSVAYLRSLKFTWKEISNVLGISTKTLCRRAAEWDISTYSTITDALLDERVAKIKTDFPNSGEVMVNGHLMAQGIHVQRQRLRDSILRLNHSQDRQVNPRIYRRVYSVPGPNFVGI